MKNNSVKQIPFFDLKPQYQSIKSEIDEAINNVLESQVFILGKEVSEFEEQVSKYLGCDYAIGVSSGSDALLVALMGLDIGFGDEVITTPLSWIITSNAISSCGAVPVFVDIKDDLNINEKLIEKSITKKTKAIMAVHLYGHSADMDKLKKICNKNKIFLIADCAESLGATYKRKEKNTLGDVSAFSFFGNKMITTGEGGMILFKKKSHYEKAKILRDHGMSKTKKYYQRVFFH